MLVIRKIRGIFDGDFNYSNFNNKINVRVIFFRLNFQNYHRCALLKNQQKYLLMIKINPNSAAKLYEPLMEYGDKPIEGVTLEEAYQVFGEWDFAILFHAETNVDALRFVGNKIRILEGVNSTFTIPLAPIRNYSKQ